MLLRRQLLRFWVKLLVAGSIWSEANNLHRLCHVCSSLPLNHGRRPLTDTSALVGAVLQTAAQNIEMLFVGRVIGGVASGIIFGVCPMFMSEISPPEFRGRVGGLYNININCGYTRTSTHPSRLHSAVH
jgi:MFS family permease